jgi:hypothetical protein
MKDLKLSPEEHSRLIEKFQDVPEVAAIRDEFLTPEMMARQIGSPEVKEYFERLDALLQMLERDEDVRYGTVHLQ